LAVTIRCYEKAGNLKYLLVNEAQTPGFFIARVNACFSLPFLFRIKTNYTIVVK